MPLYNLPQVSHSYKWLSVHILSFLCVHRFAWKFAFRCVNIFVKTLYAIEFSLRDDFCIYFAFSLFIFANTFIKTIVNPVKKNFLCLHKVMIQRLFCQVIFYCNLVN